MSMRNIYRKIAKENDVTVKEVKREMQAAIDYAYSHTIDNGATEAYQNQVTHKSEIPTTEEFLKYAVQKIKGNR